MNKILFLAVSVLLTLTGCKQSTTQKRSYTETTATLENFHKIEIQTVAEVCFTQADTCAIRISGKSEHVQDITVQVENDYLTISHKNPRKRPDKQQGVKIELSAPDLTEVRFEGVGTFSCPETIQTENIRFSLKGVGEIDIKDLKCQSAEVEIKGVGSSQIHVDCETLTASLEGVGSLTLSGKARTTRFHKKGVGSLDTQMLTTGE